jgi:cytochrome c551/c552
MQRLVVATLMPVVLGLGLGAAGSAPAPQPSPAAPRLVPSHVQGRLAAEHQTALVKEYCATCHSDRTKAGGLSLAGFDAGHAGGSPETSEKMIRKLRTGMMPPAGARRPEEAVLSALATALESEIDAVAARNPDPGWRPFQRLNRAEYARAVRDLLDLDVDVAPYLPADTISQGFDNVADAQALSPTLTEGYLRAASQISRLAVGDREATAGSATYMVPRTTSQMRHVEGTPIGTRGGLSVVHVFPADGVYTFRMMLFGSPTGELFAGTTLGSRTPWWEGVRGEQIEVSINGERVAVLDIDPQMTESDPNGLNLQTPRIQVAAGPQRVSAAFVQRFDGPIDDLMAPIEHSLADSRIGTGLGISVLPHLRDFAVNGPFVVTGVSETPSRQRIFSCRPTTAGEEPVCAAEIVRRLAGQAYRGGVSAEDFEGLMRFYERGRARGGFESGVRMAIEALLASPKFIFRFEGAPATLRAGERYRLSDHALASRLSFFLWGAGPDAVLLAEAARGRLGQPAVLEAQVRRMLADPRSEALATRFAGQWLRLQDVDKVRPDSLAYPHWDQSLAESLRRETELFFDSLVREDHSLRALLTADWSFVNERVARHYGMPNIVGSHFRRVTLPAERRGILGHGSMLLQTSTADRTSPVNRGRWVMEVLLASPPPAPPPNVPELEEVQVGHGGRLLTVRERMEEHRANPACNSCHRVIDPLGLALENYDATGQWRIKDNGVPIDPSGALYDGTPIDGPSGLRAALLKHEHAVMLGFTESLMTYALGRRVEVYDMPAVRRIVRETAEADYRLSSFVLGIVRSPAFSMSRQTD